MFGFDGSQQIGPCTEVIADGCVVTLTPASLICRFDTACIPRSANNRSAACRIASRVPDDRSLLNTLAAVIASVDTHAFAKSSSLFKWTLASDLDVYDESSGY